MKPQSDRLGFLRSYLDRLAFDMAAAGKFRASGQNPVDAAVSAILQGGSAMATQLAADLKKIGGEKIAIAQMAIEGMAASAAANLTHRAAGALGEAVVGLFAKKPPAKSSEKQRVGKGFMDAAAKMRR